MEVFVTKIEELVWGPVCSQMSPGPKMPFAMRLGRWEDQPQSETGDISAIFFEAPSLLKLISESTDRN